MQPLTLDDLMNIRDALNEKISALVDAGTKKLARTAFTGREFGNATRYAETRDKIQAEIEARQQNPHA